MVEAFKSYRDTSIVHSTEKRMTIFYLDKNAYNLKEMGYLVRIASDHNLYSKLCFLLPFFAN